MNNNYTSLAGVKWSKSSLIKCLEQNYNDSLKALLDDDDMTPEEMIKRSKQMLEMFRSIYDPIMDHGVTVKKEKEEEK